MRASFADMSGEHGKLGPRTDATTLPFSVHRELTAAGAGRARRQRGARGRHGVWGRTEAGERLERALQGQGCACQEAARAAGGGHLAALLRALRQQVHG